MSAMRDFRQCSMRYGDKIVRAIEVVCGKCGSNGHHPRGSSKTLVGPQEERQRFVRMFERDGWLMGLRPQDDRCPRCVAAAKAEKREKLTVISKEPPRMITEPPRPMSPEDGRVIYAKLEELYSTDGTGFRPGWTDQKVATDLGVPRAWVESTRKQFFGPEGGNPEISSALAEAKQMLTEARALTAKFTTTKDTLGSLIAEAQKLNSRAELVERKLATIEKAVRP